MCFVATKGAGHTEPGTPYEAKWKDDKGNTCCRNVPRPKIISKYFLQSNKIDMFNQSRQSDLKLEKHWITNNGYFRCITTLFGICVTDAWKGYQYHLGVRHRHKGQELMDFAKLLTKDLLENKYDNHIPDKALVIHHGTAQSLAPAGPIMFPCSPHSQVSSLTQPTLDFLIESQRENVVEHLLVICNEEVLHFCGHGKNQRSGKRKKSGVSF
jgi:hypothetical protein